ncbi:hypothetical protein [Streptomyces kebangsaanensis]|uniref:hypothetical protein n=1 Tax=Streptomyces kebangsaanensis TaxID=864058 RepID=UPI00093B1A52|nr:hypothetical protein [Streptomyces kebangsaanensis]
MRTRTALAAVLLALAALTAACGSDNKPSKPAATSVATSAAAVDTAEARQACVDAWAETISNRPADFNPDTDSDTEPNECKGLPEGDWTDRYMDGLTQSNQDGRDALQDLIDQASEAAQP